MSLFFLESVRSTLPRYFVKKHNSKLDRRKNAQRQIEKLLSMSMRERGKSPSISERHAKLAWKMATRFNVKLGTKRLLFCHSCKSPIVPAYDSRYRIRTGQLVITCFKCGAIYHKKLEKAST